MAYLRKATVDPDPIKQFQTWIEEAIAAGLPQPLGMHLATATPSGKPSARMVLLRGYDQRGLAFFTNYESRKSLEMEANPVAALVFYWPELDRQVRIEGTVERVSPDESDLYFQTRPRGSQLSTWVSPQSRVIESREVLDHRMEQLRAEYADQPIPRPPYWGGYRVVPTMFEFWAGQPDRLHDRLRYRREENGGWILERLAP